jgi:4-hydroxybutyrate CoA-transferase
VTTLASVAPVRITRGRPLTARPLPLALEDVAQVVRAGDTVIIGHGGGWPRSTVEALVHGARHPFRILHNRIDDELPYFSSTSPRRAHHAGFMAGHATRDRISSGEADFIPNCYGLTPTLIESGAVACDVVVLHVSPPDEDGWCSLGACVAYLPAAISRARLVIAQVNAQMPRSKGTYVNVCALDHVIEVDVPLQTVPSAVPDEVTTAIAANAASLIDDGATIQLGIGKLADAVLRALAGKSGLRMHTETFGDSALELIEQGTLVGGADGAPAIVATFVTGSERLYRALGSADDILMMPVNYTNNPTVLGALDRFVGVNSAIEVDLSGQINAESIGPKLYSGPGGHLDFAISAAYGRNGRYVCALPSVAAGGTVSRNVPRLAHGSTVTVPRSLADVVVTEHGIARLRGLTTRERAEALIEVAHPDHRPQLRAAMKAGETSW